MPKECVCCGQALEELVQEIRQMTTRDYLAPTVAARMESALREAIAEAEKDTQDLDFILGRLNGAKALIEGGASAGGLLGSLTETIALVNSHLP